MSRGATRRSGRSSAPVGIAVGAAVVGAVAWAVSPWVELMRRRRADESGLLWLDVDEPEAERVNGGDAENIDRDETFG